MSHFLKKRHIQYIIALAKYFFINVVFVLFIQNFSKGCATLLLSYFKDHSLNVNRKILLNFFLIQQTCNFFIDITLYFYIDFKVLAYMLLNKTYEVFNPQ